MCRPEALFLEGDLPSADEWRCLFLLCRCFLWRYVLSASLSCLCDLSLLKHLSLAELFSFSSDETWLLPLTGLSLAPCPSFCLSGEDLCVLLLFFLFLLSECLSFPGRLPPLSDDDDDDRLLWRLCLVRVRARCSMSCVVSRLMMTWMTWRVLVC